MTKDYYEVPGAKEWLVNTARVGRKFNPPLILDQLIKEGKVHAITIPEDPEEAKVLLVEIMKNYPAK